MEGAESSITNAKQPTPRMIRAIFRIVLGFDGLWRLV